jgi:arylsulfatase A-like enzyme
MADISRRDFLKLLSITPMAILEQPLVRIFNLSANPDQQNIILLVFDTWSADHVQLYGYPRETMPNLSMFADNALVYHRHYSAGTFTVPGTASLLTGLYPWSHRAILLGGEITPEHRNHQIFNLLSPTHSTVGYAQNQYANIFLYQVGQELKTHIPIDNFDLEHGLIYDLPIFRNDQPTAFASFEDDIFQTGVGFDGSLFLGPLSRLITSREREALNNESRLSYPRGLPKASVLFRLEDIIDGAIEILKGLSQPSLVYLHFFPPHGPYRPKGKYNHRFDDGWQAVEKPVHALSQSPATFKEEEDQRRRYDQYLASWDAELSRLLDYMKASGLLDTSYVMLTSDHGELFERGEIGHNGYLIYDPIIHVPLIISRPGQKERIDIQTPTSNVDILPTIASLIGRPIPDWAEGQVLPEFGGFPDQDRDIYAMDAKTNSAHAALTRISISLTKNDHRLTYYQYPNLNYKEFELFNLEDDPDELNNLYPAQPQIAHQLQDELLQKLAEENRRFQN